MFFTPITAFFLNMGKLLPVPLYHPSVSRELLCFSMRRRSSPFLLQRWTLQPPLEAHRHQSIFFRGVWLWSTSKLNWPGSVPPRQNLSSLPIILGVIVRLGDCLQLKRPEPWVSDMSSAHHFLPSLDGRRLRRRFGRALIVDEFHVEPGRWPGLRTVPSPGRLVILLDRAAGGQQGPERQEDWYQEYLQQKQAP